MLPYSAEALFALYAHYNLAIWPIQILFFVLALVGLLVATRSGAQSAPVIGGILGLAWVWTGVAFHLQNFATINFAAPLFAGLFIVQGVVLLWVLQPARMTPGRSRSGFAASALAAAALVALILVPFLDWLSGNSWTQLRLFGVAPEPTVLYALALLGFFRGHRIWPLLLVPFAWLAMTAMSAWVLEIQRDWTVVATGLAFLFWLLWPVRRV